jgi:AcrR family transcriptional regulator
MQISLREQKKAANHDAIFAAAITLFSEKGYNKTTLSDIAETANVSQRTIFAYYPSKEAIIFEPYRLLFDDLFDHIDNRGEMTVFESLRLFAVPERDSVKTEELQALIESNTELQEYSTNLMATLESKLTEAIATEKGLRPDSIQAFLIGSACRAIISYSINNHGDKKAADVAFKFIDAGLAATT